MTTNWALLRVVTGDFCVKCDHCPRYCTSRYEIIQNRETLEILNVGQGCAFELTGIKIRRPEPQISTDTGTPDWMLA